MTAEQMIRICSGDPRAWLRRYGGHKPLYVCVLSYTHTGEIPGISAAGQTPQARQYTALADGHYLLADALPQTQPLQKRPVYCRLPALQAGVSPAVISRAILTRQEIPCCLMSTGLPDRLRVPHIALPKVMARSLETGHAMTPQQVNQLWESGLRWGHRLSRLYAGRYLILGESVVGGTTTAQALLSALGYEIAGKMSSSHPNGNHQQKRSLVNTGLSVWRRGGDVSAFAAVEAVGDPMQVVAAALALAASKRMGVLLAGGSQMLAVYALIKAICLGSKRSPAGKLPASDLSASDLSAGNPASEQIVSERIVVGTTRWVIEDKSADTVFIARAVGAPYLASEISFRQSLHEPLRDYERGFVKEGVGAGGCAIAASLLSGWTQRQLREAVESDCF